VNANLVAEKKTYTKNITSINNSIKFERKKKEDKQRELNDLEVQMNDLINKNQIEVKTYKERVKDILCENQGRVNENMMNNFRVINHRARENRQEQHDFKKDVNLLNKKIREKETMLEQHIIATNKQDFEQWREKRLQTERDLNELKII